MYLLLAHGGTGGLIAESFPVLAIAALWVWVWRRSKRADEDADLPDDGLGANARGAGDEPRVEQRGG